MKPRFPLDSGVSNYLRCKKIFQYFWPVSNQTGRAGRATIRGDAQQHAWFPYTAPHDCNLDPELCS